jgi:hypothetical protein
MSEAPPVVVRRHAVDESNDLPNLNNAQPALHVIMHAPLNASQTYSTSDMRGSVRQQIDEWLRLWACSGSYNK